MVTRSQAKRKAEEEIPGSPAKSSKSSSSDDTTSRRRTRSPQPDDTDEDPPVESAATGTKKQNNSQRAPSGGNNNVEEEQNAGVQQEDDNATVAENTEKARKDLQTADAALKKRLKDDASSLLVQMQTCVERRRLDREDFVLPAEDERQRFSLLLLCERATEEGMAQNRRLKFLGPQWFEQMQALQEAMTRSSDVRKELDEAGQHLIEALEKYDEAVGECGDVLVGNGSRGKPSEDDKRVASEKVGVAHEEMRLARAECSRLQGLRNECNKEEHMLSVEPLQTAEVLLVPKKFLPLRQPTPPEEIEESPRTEDQSASRPRANSEGSWQTTEGTSARSFERNGSVDRREVEDDDPERQVEQRDEAAFKRNVVREVQDQANLNLENAREVFHDAERRFNDVRADYMHNLLGFVERKDAGDEDGTKTEFDLSYYLSRRKFNGDVARAHGQFDDAVRDAAETDALPVSERIRMFDDERAGSAASTLEGELRIMRDRLTKERAEVWRFDRRHKDMKSSQHWSDMVSEVPAGGAEPDSFLELERRKLGMADSFLSRRKHIDDWNTKQENIRGEYLNVFPKAKEVEEAELQWYEEWTGL